MVVLDRVACTQGLVREMSKEDGFDIWETGLTGLGDEWTQGVKREASRGITVSADRAQAVCHVLSRASHACHLRTHVYCCSIFQIRKLRLREFE